MQYAVMVGIALGQYWYIPTAIAVVSILIRLVLGSVSVQ